MERELTTFDLLASELRRSMDLSPAQLQQLERVLTGFGGQRLHVPATRRQRAEVALSTARRLVADGLDTAAIRDRLMGMELSRSAAYRVIDKARAAAPAAQEGAR